MAGQVIRKDGFEYKVTRIVAEGDNWQLAVVKGGSLNYYHPALLQDGQLQLLPPGRPAAWAGYEEGILQWYRKHGFVYQPTDKPYFHGCYDCSSLSIWRGQTKCWRLKRNITPSPSRCYAIAEAQRLSQSLLWLIEDLVSTALRHLIYRQLKARMVDVLRDMAVRCPYVWAGDLWTETPWGGRECIKELKLELHQGPLVPGEPRPVDPGSFMPDDVALAYAFADFVRSELGFDASVLEIRVGAYAWLWVGVHGVGYYYVGKNIVKDHERVEEKRRTLHLAHCLGIITDSDLERWGVCY